MLFSAFFFVIIFRILPRGEGYADDSMLEAMLKLQATEEFVCSVFRHQRHCEPFLAEVLYGCPEMVDAVVNDEEPVVRVLEDLHFD